MKKINQIRKVNFEFINDKRFSLILTLNNYKLTKNNRITIIFLFYSFKLLASKDFGLEFVQE